MQYLYFIDYYKSDKNHGLNTYNRELLCTLKKNKEYEINVIYLNSINTRKLITIIEDGIVCHYIPPIIRQAGDKAEWCKKLKSEIHFILNKDFDKVIIHFNWFNDFDVLVLLKTEKYKIVFTKHCIPWRDLVSNNYTAFYPLQKAFEQGKNAALNARLRREQTQYDFVDHIITVTHCAKQSLTQFFNFPEDKISVVNNGLAIDTIPIFNSKKNSSLRRKYGFGANEQLIIYAGNVNPRKGIFDVVKAFSKIVKQNPNVHLLIAGPGNYEGIIKTTTGIWSKITLLGSLDKATLYNFYNLADVGIVPSYIEQCSYTCIEMMQAGLPLLVSDVDGLREMVNEDCGLRFKVDFKKSGVSLNQKDLLAKLSYLLTQPKEAKRLGVNARKYALQYFSAERMARETVAVYEKVLDRNKEQRVKNNDEQPLVSVLLPVYNAEKFLKDCLASIFRQSYNNFELIVVNDGSTDDSHNIISTYTEARLVYLSNNENKGVSHCLNQGIALAKGKYIARIDADDMMMPDRLQKQVVFMEDNLDHVLLGSSHYLIGENGLPFDRFIPLTGHHEIKTALLFYNCVSHPTVMYRADIVKKLKYSSQFRHCEDYELWLRMVKAGKVANMPEALTQYRVHGKNISISNQKEMQQSVMELLARELDNLGIEYIAQQLLAHCAFGFGVSKQYFNSPERIVALKQWMDMLVEKLIKPGYSKKVVQAFAKKLLVPYREVKTLLVSKPKISVIMPCYNAEAYIQKAIQSVLEQNFTDFELLVIDDGSTDATNSEIAKFTDERVKYHRLPSNQGNYVARNIGIKLAKGKYLAMLDADDIALPHRLKVQFDYLEKHKSLGCVGSLSEIIDGKGQVIGKIDRPLSHNQIKISFLKDNYLTQSTLMVRKAILQKYGITYNESYRYTGDYDFVARLLSVTRVENINQVLVQYRIHATQISTAKREQQSELANKVRKAYLDLLSITYTAEELKLHLALMQGQTQKKEEIEKGIDWFNRLMEANDRLKLFNKEELFSFFKDTMMKQLDKYHHLKLT